MLCLPVLACAPAGAADFRLIEVTVDRVAHSITPTETGRLIGGRNAKFEEASHHVALLVERGGRTYICGGTALSSSWIVTAAHCVAGAEHNPAAVTTVSGTVNYSSGGHWATADEVKLHPRYVAKKHDFDFALVRSSLSSSTVGARLATVSETAAMTPEETYFVTGYGRTAENGPTSTVLRLVEVEFVPLQACTKNPFVNYSKSRITESMFCAAGFDATRPGAPAGTRRRISRDACQGDSGGPLFRNTDGVIQFGVVSWGDGCGRSGKYGVYGKLSATETWIRETTNP